MCVRSSRLLWTYLSSVSGELKPDSEEIATRDADVCDESDIVVDIPTVVPFVEPGSLCR